LQQYLQSLTYDRVSPDDGHLSVSGGHPSSGGCGFLVYGRRVLCVSLARSEYGSEFGAQQYAGQPISDRPGGLCFCENASHRMP
jgi:hypothetical protein